MRATLYLQHLYRKKRSKLLSQKLSLLRKKHLKPILLQILYTSRLFARLDQSLSWLWHCRLEVEEDGGCRLRPCEAGLILERPVVVMLYSFISQVVFATIQFFLSEILDLFTTFNYVSLQNISVPVPYMRCITFKSNRILFISWHFNSRA